MTAEAARPLRADAERNRRRLLLAAAAAFAEGGLETSIAEIARRAGVGQGTVFRRFPTKDDLIAEIVVDRLCRLAQHARRLERVEPWEGLRRCMEAGIRLHAGDRGLIEAVAGRARADARVRAAQAELLAAVERLVARAHWSDDLRDDVEAGDITFLIAAIGRTAACFASTAPQLWRRYLTLVLDGLRTDSPTPLPVRALTPRQLDRACRATANGPRAGS